MNTEKLTSRQEWKQHWPLVVACTFGFSFNSVMVAATGLFMEPLGQEFGWSRTMQSSGLSIAAVTAAILSPFFGILIDRYGARKLALPGLMLAGASITCFGFANGSVAQWMALWSIYALAAVASKSTIWTAAVSGVFDKGRGMAIGLALSGAAIAQSITPPLVNYLINEFGWRNAYAWIGMGWGGVTLIMCYFFLYDAHDLKRRSMKEGVDGKARTFSLPGLSVAEAWRSTALWRIAISTFLIMTITMALSVHQFPILLEAGVTRTNAAWLAGIAGVGGIVGKLVTGWLLDRFRPNWVGGLTLGSTAFAFLLLLLPSRSVAIIITAMVISGYAGGSKLQICGFLTSRYGGLKNFGKIFGMMGTVIAVSFGLGPLVGGVIYDIFGNYIPLLIAGVILSLFSGLLFIGLGSYPDWEAEKMASPVPAPA